jgi:hypothetical protein
MSESNSLTSKTKQFSNIFKLPSIFQKGTSRFIAPALATLTRRPRLLGPRISCNTCYNFLWERPGHEKIWVLTRTIPTLLEAINRGCETCEIIYKSVATYLKDCASVDRITIQCSDFVIHVFERGKPQLCLQPFICSSKIHGLPLRGD